MRPRKSFFGDISSSDCEAWCLEAGCELRLLPGMGGKVKVLLQKRQTGSAGPRLPVV